MLLRIVGSDGQTLFLGEPTEALMFCRCDGADDGVDRDAGTGAAVTARVPSGARAGSGPAGVAAEVHSLREEGPR